MSIPKMTCQQLIEFICDYLEGELPQDQCAHFEMHLERCPCCKNYLVSYQQTIQAGKKACCQGERPPSMPSELIQAIMAARHQQGPDASAGDCDC